MVAFNTLTLDHVGRSFGGQAALVDLTMDIHGGEFIALLGPSGCGKTTALNCLAGLLPLTTGDIRIDDQRVDTLPPEKRDFGMVFQNYALFPHMSVAKNVSFGLQMRHVGKDAMRTRVAEALAMVKLTDYAARLPGQLSGGQQQRVAIARAIVTEPRLVLMDEPLSNLDAKLRLDMRGEIRRLHQSLGLTTVYVTHDQEEALSMADRLVVLRLGHVQQIGKPTELHSNPVNYYVADFMGYRNLLDMRSTRADGRAITVAGVGIELGGVASHHTIAADEDVVAAIRPEDIRVGTGPNAFTATVEVAEYRGSGYAIDAVTSTGQTIHLLSGESHPVGAALTLTVRPERVLVYPKDPDVPVGGAAGAAPEVAP
ncbi:MAG: ABC transporter ATP-binding protein [Actinomycetia bacterium]|nr:ABC transporter ATP-binding protein [Actinomycetes bacterium]